MEVAQVVELRPVLLLPEKFLLSARNSTFLDMHDVRQGVCVTNPNELSEQELLLLCDIAIATLPGLVNNGREKLIAVALKSRLTAQSQSNAEKAFEEWDRLNYREIMNEHDKAAAANRLNDRRRIALGFYEWMQRTHSTPAHMEAVEEISAKELARRVENGQLYGVAPTQQTIPDAVLSAVERMCLPLHESRLSGVTAQEDARCMKVIRDFINSLATAPPVQTAPERRPIAPDELTREATKQLTTEALRAGVEADLKILGGGRVEDK